MLTALRRITVRELTRKEKVAMGALENALEHEPVLRPVLVSDYAHSRAELHDLRAALSRRLAALSRHPDEPGSKSAVVYRDGLAPYGSPDVTGFAPGCVY